MDENSNEQNVVLESQRDPNICAACEQSQVDRSKSSNSVLCTECREKFIKYPVPKRIYIFLIIIAILTAIAYSRTPEVIASYKVYSDADKLIEQHQYYYAEQKLDQLEQKYTSSKPIVIKLLEVAMVRCEYEKATKIINEHLVGKELSELELQKVQNYANELEAKSLTISKIDEIFKQQKDKKEVFNELNKALNEPQYSKDMLYFYMATTTENDVQKYLQKGINEDSRFLLAKAKLGDILRAKGKVSEAKDMYEQVLLVDKTNAYALRGMAIIEMLQGNKQQGLVLAKQAYEIQKFDGYIPETLIVALCENGKRQEAKEFIKELAKNQYTYIKDLNTYLNSKTTLRNYYIYEMEAK